MKPVSILELIAALIVCATLIAIVMYYQSGLDQSSLLILGAGTVAVFLVINGLLANALSIIRQKRSKPSKPVTSALGSTVSHVVVGAWFTVLMYMSALTLSRSNWSLTILAVIVAIFFATIIIGRFLNRAFSIDKWLAYGAGSVIAIMSFVLIQEYLMPKFL
ncbi:MAG: hypothetical protein ACR2P6_04245 [Gammaproteobacteria bacterium]